jgi:general secretion pathway protein F
MPDFEYTARNASGAAISGLIAANSPQDALAQLSARQIFPLKIEMAETAKTQQKQVSRRVPARHLASFYSQLADLLKSGVPLLRSLELLEGQTRQPALKAVLSEVRASVADGTRLYDAMRVHPKAFSELVCSMVRAGEEGGFLEDVLKRIAAVTEHQEEMKSKVIGALVYPMFLVVVGTAVVSILIVFFVPKFAGTFDAMKERGELPWATSALMGISESVQGYWPYGLVALIAIVVGLQQWFATDPGKAFWSRFELRSPGLGRVVRSLAIARFCRVLGTLMQNGVPLLQSLRIAKDATGNQVLADAIDHATDNITAGKSLARPLGASGEFPVEVVEMIAVAEEANNLENVLIGISDNLERRSDRELQMVVRLLEPVLLLMMAVVVLFVFVALLVPILQSSGAA